MNSDKLSLQPRNNHMAMLGAFGVLPGEAYASYACAARLLDEAAHDAAAEAPLGAAELQMQLQLGWWLASACAEAGDAAAAASWLRQTLVVQAATK